MNKVLIMGGNGFIGKNIANRFVDKGIIPDIYDISVSNDKFYSYQGNILTDDNLDEIISNYDSIIYLITSVSPKKSMDFPEESYTQDIPMLLRVLECCVKNGRTKKIIFSSSGGTVYGEGENKELTEDDTVEYPINHYAICKIACEKILLLYNKLYGMNNVILRISNPYGLGQNPASGVGVITTFVDRIVKGESIVLYGDGSTIRDFVDINTVTEAFYQALFYENKTEEIPVFNVGSGQAISLKEIIAIISECLGVEPNIQYLPERSFDVKKNVLNMEKSYKSLGITRDSEEKEKIKKYVLDMNDRYRGRNV